MYYKGSRTTESMPDLGIIASADRVSLTSEVKAQAAKNAGEVTVKTTHDITPGKHVKIAESAIEHAVPLTTESAESFAIMPLSMFERTEDGKLKPAGSDAEGFDAPENTAFVVVENKPASGDVEASTNFAPLSEESRSFNAKTTDPTTGEEKPLFDIRFGNKGSIFIGNAGEGKLSAEVSETGAEREARVAEVAKDAGRSAVASLLERASKTTVAVEALGHADAKRLKQIRKEEILAERPQLKADLREQRTARDTAKHELRSTKKETSKRKLRRERRAMVREAIAQYGETNPQATRREVRGMRKGVREVATRDVAQSAAEKLAKATNTYNEAFKTANDTRRRIHEGSRLYAVGGRNTVGENRTILSGMAESHRGDPGTLFDLDEARKKAVLAEVEAKRVRLNREKYREMRKAQLAERTATRARALHTRGKAVA